MDKSIPPLQNWPKKLVFESTKTDNTNFKVLYDTAESIAIDIVKEYGLILYLQNQYYISCTLSHTKEGKIYDKSMNHLREMLFSYLCIYTTNPNLKEEILCDVMCNMYNIHEPDVVFGYLYSYFKSIDNEFNKIDYIDKIAKDVVNLLPLLLGSTCVAQPIKQHFLNLENLINNI